jgi:hypothetical protein
MNCFNIRELQGNLKRRFFADLVNINDHREFLDSTMIGLRFKTNNEMNIFHDTLSFYNFGTTNEAKSRQSMFSNLYDANSTISVMNLFDTSFSLTNYAQSVTS